MPYNGLVGDMNGHGAGRIHQRFGIEVEVENCHRAPNGCRNSVWDTKNDGSLRGGGTEFVTRPIAYNEVSDACDLVYSWIHARGYTTGSRCGTHVHVEMNNRTIDETSAFIVAYLLSEPLIYQYVGEAREENTYCIPWYRAPEDVRAVVRGRRNRHQFLGNLLETNKYSGMYLEPLYRFGTIEFRMAPVFRTAQELKWFVSIADSLATYCIGMTPLRVVEDYYSNGPETLLREIFGDVLRERMYSGDVRTLLDKYDVETIADEAAGLEPQLPSEWVTPVVPALPGALGYHRHAESRYAEAPIPAPYSDFDEECDEDDEEYGDDGDDDTSW